MTQHSVSSKVPSITIWFWITKILTTAMGEATSDFLVGRLDPVLAVLLGALAFAAALVLQFRTRQYVPWIYWLAVAMVAVFGTMAADVLHVGLGIPYTVSSALYAVILTIVFIVWYRSEKTLSIHDITTPRREAFYWAAVLTTFALGTATGDLSATTFGLGYLASGLLFMVAIALPAFAYWKFGLNEITAFWIAYILTRPLGASFADGAGKPHLSGGLGWGDGTVSIALSALIVVLVGCQAAKKTKESVMA
jgi:uncharacterized membrane-anchored protein